MYKGANIQSVDSVLYGRIETMCKPAFGSGIISSFFMFYDGKDYKTNWNEIDFEFMGKNTNTINTNVIKTVSGATDKNKNEVHTTLAQRSSDVYWKLCIEWSPDAVIWKINDIVIRTLKVTLSNPQKIKMNIWAIDNNWAGGFNTGIMPQAAAYKYVRYSAYENGKFVYKWQDNFDILDLKRWRISEFTMGLTDFVMENVSIKNSELVLSLT